MTDNLFNMELSLRFLVPIVFCLIAATVRLSAGGWIDSAKCLADLNYAVGSKELWAIQMLDAMGKPSESILKGNTFWPGGYDQCKDVVAWTDEQLGLQRFRGRYCRLQLQAKIDLLDQLNLTRKSDREKGVSIFIGICVPDSCKAEDLIFGFNSIKRNLQFKNAGVAEVAGTVLNYVQLQNVTCVTEELLFTSDFWMFSCVLFLFVVFVITISLLDYKNTEFHDKNHELKFEEAQTGSKCSQLHKGFSNQFLLCFSIPRNMKVVFGEARANRFEFLNGMRVLSLCVVIMHHVEILPCNHLLSKSPLDCVTLHETVFGHLIFNTDAVSTFLFMGGFCFSLGFGVTRKPNLNTLFRALYIRYFRLFPPVAFFMMINKYLHRFTVEGPLWETKKCNVGFTDLLYVPLHFSCFTHLWYVGVDFQCFLLGLLLVYILKRSENKLRIAIGIIFLFVFLRAIIRDSQLDLNLKDSTNLIDLASGFSVLSESFYNFEFRSGPYLTGMLLGLYCATALEHGKGYMNPKYSRFLPFLAMTILIGITLRGEIFGKLSFESSVGYFFMWNIWGLGIGCFISCCLQDTTGLVCRFLSWTFWRPLSNLSFSAYLVNEMVIFFVMENHKFPVELDLRTWMVLTVGMVVFIFVLAVPFALLFEQPFLQVGRILKPARRG